MALGDTVAAVRDIRTFDPKTLRIRADGIPSGSQGRITFQNDTQRYVSVEFAVTRKGLQGITKIIGNFGDNTVDTIANSLMIVTDTTPPDVMDSIRTEAETIRSEQLRSI